MRIKPTLPLTTSVLLCFALLVVAVVSLHSYHFAGRAYRQDEAWVVQAAIVHAEQGGTLNTLLRNITQFATEDWLTDIWIPLVGQAEPVTRFLSTLCTAITLALVFRLGKDLFRAQVGLYAAFILGTLPFFQFFSHELRGYPALLSATAALLLLFERWLRFRHRRYMVAYMAVAVAAVYLHIFIVIVIAAQAIFFVLGVRWDKTTWRQTTGFLFATVLLLVLRLYNSFRYYRGSQGGIEWYSLTTNWEAFVILQSQMQIAPPAIGQFLLLLGLALPVAAAYPSLASPQWVLFRWGVEWCKAYLVIVPASIVGIIFAANLIIRIATPRNLIIILPSLALLAGYALAALPRQARAIIIVLITIGAIFSYEPYISTGPYFEMVDFVQADFQAGDRFLVEGGQFWEHNGFAYYLRERLPERVPNDALFHLTNDDTMGIGSLPDPPIHWVSDDSDESIAQFAVFLDHAKRVWYIRGDAVGFAERYRSILEQSYIPYRIQMLDAEQGYAPHTFIEYRRIPEQFENPYTFDGVFELRHWEIDQDVTVSPCSALTLESWWSARARPTINYSLTLALADQMGIGIARTDSAPAGILTQLWQPGQLYLDVRSLTVPCDAKAGDYPLIVSLYDYRTLEGLPIAGQDGSPRDTAYITTIHVQ